MASAGELSEVTLFSQHQQAIDRLRQRFETNSVNLALVVVGSVARGDAREESDVDCFLVVTDDEYARRTTAGDLSFNADDVGGDSQVQAGGPIVDLAFLRDVAKRGPEPARYAFVDASVVFSKVSGLEAVIAEIPRYPEAERNEKLMSFASQLPVHFSYMQLAEYSQNHYLLSETAVEIVRFGGRLILAHNRMLYPNRKQFLRVLERAPEKPAGLLDLANELLERPGIRPAREFCNAVLGFQPWPKPPEGAMARFQRDRELTWRAGWVPLADS